MASSYYPDISMGVCRSQNWEIIDQLFIFSSRILAITLVNILKEIINTACSQLSAL